MIEQFTSPVAVNNSQEPWLVGEGVVVSGGVAIPSLDFNFITGGLPGTVTFTRGSNATQFDSTGSLVYAPVNLLTWSEDFGNANWSKNQCSVTLNDHAAPNGTLTADRITATGNDAFVQQYPITGVALGATLTASIWVKGTGSTIGKTGFIAVATNSGLGTGQVFTVTANWQRVSVTRVTPVGDANGGIRVDWADPSAIGDEVYLWGAQLNPSPMVDGVTSSLTTYYPTTTTAYYGPRFDYNPATLAARGLLIEEARTNSIRNNTMQGAVAGTPGTAPTNWAVTTTGGVFIRTIVGTGTENGITYFEVRYQFSGAGTATVQYEQGTQIAAANGQTWTQSAYVKLAGGSLTNISEVRNGISENDSGGNFLAGNTTAFTPTTGAISGQRYTHTRTLNNASTAFVVSTTQIVATGAADITLRIGLPQLEQGAFATSVIPTTTTALTRSADVASVNTLAPWFNSVAGTIYAELMRPSLIASTGFANAWALSDNTNNERFLVYNTGAGQTIDATISDGGVSQGTLITGGSITANTVIKTAFAYAVNDFALVRDAGAVQTDTSGTLPTVDRLYIGANAVGTGQWTGWIRRLTAYPRRLSNAELQSLTV